MAVLIAGAVAVQTPIKDAQQQWQQLNAQVLEAYQAGEYAKGVAAAEQAVQLARQAFGPRRPDTLTSKAEVFWSDSLKRCSLYVPTTQQPIRHTIFVVPPDGQG